MRLNKKGTAFHITSSKLDYKNVRGILGDLNDNKTDDFTVNEKAHANNLTSFFSLYE